MGLLSDNAITELVQWAINKFSLSKHSHETSDVTGLNEALNGKAAANHNHTKSQITDFPTIPTKTSQLENDSGFITDGGGSGITVDSALSATSENPVQNKVVKAALDEKSKTLSNFYDTRPTSANLNSNGNGGMQKFLCTSSMTEGAPPMESHIIHMNWDSTSGWDAQLAVGCGQNKVYARNKKSGTWQDWFNVADGGKAETANTLATSRTIDGVNFNGSADIKRYATCSTAAETAEKTVSCTGFVLKTGAMVAVRFANTNTANSPTLNVNSTGAKAIRYRDVIISADVLAAGRTYLFIYNGASYELVGDLAPSNVGATVICGTYSGTGSNQTINIGATPKAVFVHPVNSTGEETTMAINGTACSSSSNGTTLEIVTNGFTAAYGVKQTGSVYMYTALV